jgi:DNA-directed RNA polymerase subunit RPC12/RpoP
VTSEPEFVPPLARIFRRRRARTRHTPLDDGSTLDVRCPRCAAALRMRCGRTNACPRCGEKVTVPGADVARSLMPVSGSDLAVRRSLTEPGETALKGPLIVLGYERPWYLVRVRGEETGWVNEWRTRLVPPVPPA